MLVMQVPAPNLQWVLILVLELEAVFRLFQSIDVQITTHVYCPVYTLGYGYILALCHCQLQARLLTWLSSLSSPADSSGDTNSTPIIIAVVIGVIGAAVGITGLIGGTIIVHRRR